MKWDNLTLHVEHLLPGVVVAAVLLSWDSALADRLLGLGDFVGSIVFVAAAYLLGVVTLALTRALLDRFAERTFQYWAFRIYLPDACLRDGRHLGWREMDEEYVRVRSLAERRDSDRVREEISKRRERGRLLRAAALPGALLATMAVASRVAWWWGALVGVGVAGLILFLYGHVQVSIFEEARHYVIAEKEDGSGT